MQKWADLLIRNQQVAGSIPAGGSSFSISERLKSLIESLRSAPLQGLPQELRQNS